MPTKDSTASVSVTTADQVEPLDAQLQLAGGHCAVVGLQWGDEGKGKIVDLLTRRYDLVVRYNGGANAGHSVQVGETRYALHLIPSGILYPDKINVLGNGVVIDPAKLLEEIQGLRQRGVVIAENLRISNRAHVVFPYHKLQDTLMEAAISKARGNGGKIGTTGRGIGPAYADKASRSTAIRVGDLLDRDALADKLKHIVALKNVMLGALAQSCDQPFEPFDVDQLVQQYAGYGQSLGMHICDTTQLLHQASRSDKQLLFEGANATLLDIDHGTYPYVTSSNCSALGVSAGTGVPAQQVKEVVGIMKAYSTRVGGGPFPTELHDETGERIRQVGREFGTTTGRPRRCGWLDLVAVKYSAMVSGVTSLSVMLLDVLAGLPTLKICVGYELDGRRLDAFPADAAALSRVQPVYDEMPGFSASIDDCVRYEDLPAEARAYVQRIEQIVGVPVRVVSVGPRRHQTLVRT